MAKKIGVAIIGSGIFVKEEHLPAVHTCPDLELKAIYSRTLKSASALSAGVDIYSDDSSDSQNLSALLSRSDIHAVIIALPITIQAGFIRKALAAGKHVLAEKPMAKDVAEGTELLEWYRKEVDGTKVNFSIAEQYRFKPSFARAAEKIEELGGKLVGFRLRRQACVQGGRYFETEWRKNPTHQGGFLLDGGVHDIAGIRTLLAAGDSKLASICSFSTLLQDHLPPVDTVDAACRLSNGRTGTISMSFGASTFQGAECTVACEKGSVSVDLDTITVKPKDGEASSEEVQGNKEGVKLEVFAWAKSLQSGKWDARQSAEEGLADLEVLEAMLKSGEQNGKPVELEYQV